MSTLEEGLDLALLGVADLVGHQTIEVSAGSGAPVTERRTQSDETSQVR